MADQVTTTSSSPAGPPNGTVISTDDSGATGHIQRIKLSVSADGDATHITATAADGLLVNLGTNNDVSDGGGSLTVDAPVATPVFVRLSDGASAITALPVTDNASSLTVDNAALSVTGGGVESGALRVTIASDSTGVLSVDDNGSSLTVDGTVAISGTVTVDSELPVAAALADNAANPTAPAVGAFGMV